MSDVDWLSQLLKMITVTGQLEVRCACDAPWRVAWPKSAAHEFLYHIVLEGRAILKYSKTETATELEGGDLVLLPHGSEHVRHDGSGHASARTRNRRGSAGWVFSENDGQGERLDMLCGRFFVMPPHDRLIRNYLPTNLVIRAMDGHGDEGIRSASTQVASLLGLMRVEFFQPSTCRTNK